MTRLEKRQCGSCKACCIELEIAAPELRKKARIPCRHLAASGCGVYAARPGICQQFLCGWRLFEELDEAWRPDISGVMILRRAQAELPAAWRHALYGVHLEVIGGEEAVRRPALADYAAGLLAQGTPVLLSAASPHIVLNEHVEAGDPGLKARLAELYRLLHAARFGQSLWKRLGPLYRLQIDRGRKKYRTIPIG